MICFDKLRIVRKGLGYDTIGVGKVCDRLWAGLHTIVRLRIGLIL